MLERVGLVLNKTKPEAERIAGQASLFFQKHGISVSYLQTEERPEYPQMILTFGGDGTLLTGARYATEWGIPLLGFNLGTMGFLTEVDPKQLTEALQALLEERYSLENRSLLHVRNEQTGECYLALNDAVITRGGYARLIRVQSSINGAFHDLYTADGMIVATPTGSTGYSLSAGGPIVEPDMNCMVITPVCAHSLQHCSTIVSDQSTISLRLILEREQTAELQIDGQNKGTLQAGDSVTITGTDKKISLVRFKPYEFYRLMRMKLVEWGSDHE